jgi:hypothetical protein
MIFETTGYLRVCHVTANARFAHFMVNENVHLDFGDDDSCIHRRLASYGFAMTVSLSFGLFFFFCESIGVGHRPTKVSCIHK